MYKLTFIALLTFCSSVVYSQQDFFILKKRNKKIAFFKKYSYITFQLKSREWITGYITKVQNDSFYVNPMVVHYSWMGADTVHYNILPVSLADVFAMPRKGEQSVYVNDRVKIILGNEHWVWIKNGWLFRVGGGGYTMLNTTNSLLQKDPPFASNNIGKLGIGAAVFLIGELLHLTYKPTLRIGKKYHIQSIKVF